MKALICGAGIAGLTLAHRLDSLGWEVTVVEKADAPREQGYMIDFWGLGYDAAERMGLLPRLRELSRSVEEWSYMDRAGRRVAALKQSGFQRALHGRLLTLMRPHIEQVVREHLGDRVGLRYGHTITGITQEPGAVTATLTGGDRVRADLLVGADGIHSTVRAQLFGPERQHLRYLGFHMAAWLFDDPVVHRELRGRFCFTDSFDHQLGLYGTRDDRVAAFAVHRTPDPAMPARPRDTIERTYRDLGWLVPRVLDQLPPGDQIYYDPMAQIVMPRWHEGRAVLLGDSCAAVSPLASQGASLAMAGAYLLARQLELAPDVPTALARYQRLWQPVVGNHQRGGRRGAQWFLPDSPRNLLIRRVGVRLTSLPGVSALVSNALGAKPGPGIEELSTQP